MDAQKDTVVTPSFLANIHIFQSDIAVSAGISRVEIMLTITQRRHDPNFVI